MQEGATDNALRQAWDRLALLLIACPRVGWETEFEEISHREMERLATPDDIRGCDG